MGSVKKNYLYSLINTISGLLFPVITFPYVARVLMPDGIGEINFLNSVIAYITIFTSLGIPTYAVRAIARVKDNNYERDKTAIEIIIIQCVLTIIGYGVVIILGLVVPEINKSFIVFLILSSNILFTAIGAEWFFSGVEDFKYITIRGLIIKILLTIFLFLTVKSQDDIIFYAIYCALGTVGGNVFNFFYLRKYLRFEKQIFYELKPSKHILTIIKIFSVTVCTALFLNLGSVLLGFLKDNESVGFYTAALRISKLVMGLTTSLTVVLLPRFTNLIANNDRETHLKLLNKSYGFIISFSLPISIGLAILAPCLIELFCGPNYAPSIPCLIISAPVIVFISISYLIAQSLYSIGKETLVIYGGILELVVNLLICLLIIPALSEIGAIIGNLMAEFADMVLYLIFAKKYFGLNIMSNHTTQCIISAFIMALFIYPFSQLQINNLIILPLCVCIGFIVYVLNMKLMKNKMLDEFYQKIKDFYNGRRNTRPV